MRKILAILTLFPVISYGQQLEVMGEARITGSIALAHPEDSSSLHIGLKAGKNTVYPYLKGNTFIGFHAGALNTTGQGNTFVGHETGTINGQGQNNTFIGYQAGRKNKSGINTFVGVHAGEDNETGYNNTFVGASSGELNTSGYYNTFFGSFAGVSNKTGRYNTTIGYYANVTSSNLTNATAIGNQAEVNASNKIRLGDVNVTVIEGEVAFSASSDRRLKEHIRTVPLGLDFIERLNPVIYHRKTNAGADLEMGLIAQEVLTALDKSIDYPLGMVHQAEESYYSIRYNDLFAPMIKAIQELSHRVREVENQLEAGTPTRENGHPVKPH